MYIKHLEIMNFQAHESLSFDLSPRLNAITGESDRGKSTVLRALRWVLLNKPDGQQYRRTGTRETMVSITLDNDITISRVRSNTVNRYVLEKPGEKSKLFDSIGIKVPEEISECFGRLIADFGEDYNYELSIANQFEGPFLLRESGGVRALILGTLSKTTLLDSSAKLVNSGIRGRGRHLKLIEEELERLNGDLTKYDDLQREEEQITSLQREVDQTGTLHKKVQRASEISRTITKFDESITKREARLVALDKLPDVGALELAAANSIRVTEVAIRLDSIQKSIPKTEAVIERIEAILPKHVRTMEQAGEVYRKALDFSKRAADWKRRYQKTTKAKRDADSEFETKVQELLDSIGDLCPTCYGEVDAETKERIAQELQA